MEILPIVSIPPEQLSLEKDVVRISEDIIYKPRSMYWEWLFLSKDSPVRHKLDFVLTEECKYSPLQHFPELKYFDLETLCERGRVSFLEIKSLTLEDIEREDCLFEKVGYLLGLLTWFGVKDNYHRNMAIGYDPSGKLILAPIDIEKVFNKINSPMEVGLVLPKEAGIEGLEHSGLRDFYVTMSYRKFKLHVADILHGYQNCLKALHKHEKEIDSLMMQQEGIKEAPIRVGSVNAHPCRLIREKTLHIDDVRDELCLSEGEIAQIHYNRNPSFYRRVDNAQIYYLDEFGKPIEDEKMMARDLGHLQFCDGQFFGRNFTRLFKNGSAILAKELMPADSIGYEWRYKDTIVKYHKDRILIESGGEVIIETPFHICPNCKHWHEVDNRHGTTEVES